MEILVPISFFAMIAAVVIVPRYLRTRERERLQDTLRASIERGAPLPPEILEALTTDVKTRPTAASDLRKGLVWLGVGVGLATFGVAVSFSEPDALFPLVGMSALPAFIGLAFVLISVLDRKRG
jgi:hypothetical protein